LVDEFGKSILFELDYRNEASNVSLLARNMAQFDTINVPTVYADLTTSKVMVMEFVPGVKISDVERIEAAGWDCRELARDFVQAMIKQALFDGFFHADPHPGNVLVNLETGRIGFLDMGLMGELNRIQRMALGDVLLSMVQGDGYSLGKAGLRLSRPVPGAVIDEGDFLEDMERFGQRFLGSAQSMAAAFDALQNVMRQHGLRLDPNFVLAFKTLMQADQIIRALDPEMDFSQTAVESSSLLLRDQLNSETITNMVTKQATRSARDVVYRIPSLIEASTKWLDQYEKGRLSVHVDTSELTPQVEKLDRAMSNSLDRLLLGLVLTGWLVGAAIASTVNVNVLGFPLSDLAYYMFLAGAAVGAYVAIQTIRRLNRSDEIS
jgi:ubiquinone biosynthesis protein